MIKYLQRVVYVYETGKDTPVSICRNVIKPTGRKNFVARYRKQYRPVRPAENAPVEAKTTTWIMEIPS